MSAVNRRCATRQAGCRRPRRADVFDFRPRAGVRADDARDPLLRGRPDRAAAPGQTRVYGERERTRIKLILRGKRLGLALSEIRELFDIYATTGNERPQLAKFLQMLADRRAMLHQQREDIDAVLAEIASSSAIAGGG